ncbi:8-oxo-dGTP diphosphatase [Thermomonospora echinospora]|uniref:8-oxo-dGTP diphosphatase n=1 Tax=Thermomonospora echinospora TaxID=1992 RepID=A0A1H6CI83_9ACTN|nr:NUDIX domain-containing protein [Thermomonospora echinospora]SEG72664.1 8-oxo-dGTP diphosphatase [Thermomonospora echinospora]
MAETVPEGALIRAAGVVLWRGGPDGPRVALVHRPKYDDWSFPKGKLDKGEHVLAAALREAEEETGLTVRLGRRLPTTTYMKSGRPKRVDYWSATAIGAGRPFVPNHEVDRLEWLPVDDAARLLTYERDVDLLHEFAAGPAVTRPVVILRHASAGDKRHWRDDDALRPLDEHGRCEARLLADLLGAFGPLRPVSSATARCVETLLPYTLANGAEATTAPAFTIGRPPEQARRKLDELIDEGVPFLVCTHGEIVADLVTELCRRLGEKAPDDPSLRKGSFWVAHLSTDPHGHPTGIAALERHSTHPR